MKRFTDTAIWSKAWFRRLPCRQKALWRWLCDNCDNAGTIKPDWELASFQIGENVSESDLKAFEDRIIKVADGRLWLSGFIDFQYGKLSHKCAPHRKIFDLIDTLSLPYKKGTNTLKEEEEEEEKEVSSVFGIQDRGVGEGTASIPETDTDPWTEFKRIYPNNGSLQDPMAEEAMRNLCAANPAYRAQIMAAAASYAAYMRNQCGAAYPHGKFIARACNWLEKRMWTTDWAAKLEAEASRPGAASSESPKDQATRIMSRLWPSRTKPTPEAAVA
jgi:hypothetical protein